MFVFVFVVALQVLVLVESDDDDDDDILLPDDEINSGDTANAIVDDCL
jgi:hypothetical protein